MKIIIAGASAIGSHLARLLSRSNQDIVLIDEDADKLGDISSNYDLMTLVGEATNPKTLRSAGVTSANLFIAVTPDENVNTTCCVMAKAMGAQKTVAQIDRPEYMTNENKALFKRMGIDELIYPEMLAARDIVNGTFGRIRCTCFEKKKLCSLDDTESSYYVRLLVDDKPGVLGTIATVFGNEGVSLKSVVQTKESIADHAEIVAITHMVEHRKMLCAVKVLEGLPVVDEIRSMIRVENDRG